MITNLRFTGTGTQLLTDEASERSRLQAEQQVGEAQQQEEEEEERQRADRLAAHLRSRCVDPDTLGVLGGKNLR